MALPARTPAMRPGRAGIFMATRAMTSTGGNSPQGDTWNSRAITAWMAWMRSTSRVPPAKRIPSARARIRTMT